MREIFVVNQSKKPFPDFANFVAAAQGYADKVSAAGWPACHLTALDVMPAPGFERIVVWDDVDQPGVLAYHDDLAGAPIGHTFRHTSEAAGVPFGIAFGHELAEQLGDPFINLLALSGKGNLVAYENVDPVEDARYGFKIGAYLFPDFVLPSYFDPANRVGPYDFQGVVKVPFQVMAGGYLGMLDSRTGRWGTLEGEREVNRSGDPVRSDHAFTRKARRGKRQRCMMVA